MNHKAKIKLARRLRTDEERKQGVGLFDSLGWRKRKWQIANRVYRKNLRIKAAIFNKQQRKEAEANGV